MLKNPDRGRANRASSTISGRYLDDYSFHSRHRTVLNIKKYVEYYRPFKIILCEFVHPHILDQIIVLHKHCTYYIKPIPKIAHVKISGTWC